MTRRRLFYKVNGFSNKYFGWGYEDLDLEERAKLYKKSINRAHFIKRRTTPRVYDPTSNDDPQRIPRSVTTTKPYYNSIWLNKKTRKELKNIAENDGLSSCHYQITDVSHRPIGDVVIYTVTLQ
jgi:beta-1,4-galactosyltransferase 4